MENKKSHFTTKCLIDDLRTSASQHRFGRGFLPNNGWQQLIPQDYTTRRMTDGELSYITERSVDYGSWLALSDIANTIEKGGFGDITHKITEGKLPTKKEVVDWLRWFIDDIAKTNSFVEDSGWAQLFPVAYNKRKLNANDLRHMIHRSMLYGRWRVVITIVDAIESGKVGV